MLQEISTRLCDSAFLKFENRKNDFKRYPGILLLKVVEYQDMKSVLSLISNLNSEVIFLKSFKMFPDSDYYEHSNESVAQAQLRYIRGFIQKLIKSTYIFTCVAFDM